jgi:ribosome-associated toxin RatA of RatAB toxin-antitoxin module
MPIVRRSALVNRPAAHLFALVNDVAAYPRRFTWCVAAEVQSASGEEVQARLDLRIAGFETWFSTRNRLFPPERIEMHLANGPFQRLQGTWHFRPLDESACKVELVLDFEPASRLLAPALALGMQGLADRMVDDFVRVARSEAT